MKTQNRFLMWDFDGTLAKRNGGWAGALLSVLQKYDPATPVTAAQIEPYLQSGFPWHAPEILHSDLSADEWWTEMLVVFGRAFRSVGVDSAVARNLARQVRLSYLELSNWQRYEDAIPTLRSLSDQGWCHILLSNHVPEMPKLLDHLGLTSYFAVVFNSAQTGWEKPNGHAFRLAQDWISAQVKPGAIITTWVIGDGISSDIYGAQEAGLPAILVHTSPPKPGIPFSDNLAGLMKLLR